MYGQCIECQCLVVFQLWVFFVFRDLRTTFVVLVDLSTAILDEVGGFFLLHDFRLGGVFGVFVILRDGLVCGDVFPLYYSLLPISLACSSGRVERLL